MAIEKGKHRPGAGVRHAEIPRRKRVARPGRPKPIGLHRTGPTTRTLPKVMGRRFAPQPRIRQRTRTRPPEKREGWMEPRTLPPIKPPTGGMVNPKWLTGRIQKGTATARDLTAYHRLLKSIQGGKKTVRDLTAFQRGFRGR